jgi:hypothetical protein
MRLMLFSLVVWSLSACSAVTLSVRGEATIPMVFSRASLAETRNGAQIVGRTEDTSCPRPLRTIALTVRNSSNEAPMEIDWKEMTILSLDGTKHGVHPAGDVRANTGGESALTILPLQSARLEIAPADAAIVVQPPPHPTPGTVVTAGTLRLPVKMSGKRETAEVPITFSSAADLPEDARPHFPYNYSTRIPFDPGLAGLLGTMCVVTAPLIGGLCWMYLIFPSPPQRERATEEAREALRQQYGAEATMVSSDVQQVGW